jgi:hypothetical protein
MIGKVAEVLALKRSFSINGVVSEEEIGHDGAGSKEAAQAVAQEKIAAAIKGEPVYVPIEEVETTLHEDIVNHPPKATKATKGKPYDPYAMYKAMDPVKERFLLIDKLSEYRSILGSYGASKRDELPTDDGGAAARACYNELKLRVADLEVEAIKAGKLPDPFLPTLSDFPTEYQPFCRVLKDGVEKTYQWVDDDVAGTSGFKAWNPSKKGGRKDK